MSMREAVIAEARSWLGTPYHHHGRIKGPRGGVDCAMLLAEVFEACGLIQRVEPGDYPIQWFMHRDEERFLHWVLAAGGREVQAPAPGDVGVFQFGRTYSHGAIFVEPGLVVHAHGDSQAVVLCRLTEHPLAGAPAKFFTLFPEGQ